MAKVLTACFALSLLALAQSAPPIDASGKAVVEALDDLTPNLDDWYNFLSTLSEEDAAARMEEYRAKHGLPLDFWAGPEVETFPTLAQVSDEHPCDNSATAFVKRMPGDEQAKAVESDPVVEFDDDGNVVRKCG